jgi:GNAT superfamily N-acetyltransferase
MDITIRQATPRDAAVIARFNSLMAEETEGRSLDPQRLHEGVEALLSDPSKGIYFLAESEGTILGQLMITHEWSDWRNGNFWWIQSVYVEKESRAKGVFKALYHHVHRLARADKTVCGLRLYVEKQNERAARAYERLGMKKAHYAMFEIDFVL